MDEQSKLILFGALMDMAYRMSFYKDTGVFDSSDHVDEEVLESFMNREQDIQAFIYKVLSSVEAFKESK